MPIKYIRRLTSAERTAQANRHLGYALAFVAGAINAGGFLAVRQYTSHMTGIVSSMADSLVLGMSDVVLVGLSALVSFVLGAATSAIMVNYARRRQLHSIYAAPLLLEATLLMGFGLLGGRLAILHTFFMPVTVMLLCFIMGLQNALITKVSKAEIRTTHVTGIVTDIGIELGKMLYWNRPSPERAAPPVVADWSRLRILSSLLALFFLGGIVGALGFNHVGYISTLPLALVLVVLAAMPLLDDLVALARKHAPHSSS
jgi:uncharacterized membrane protein YoaK (UPF0700 family)